MYEETRGKKWGVVVLTLFNSSKIWLINEYFPNISFLGTQWRVGKEKEIEERYKSL